MFNITPIQKSGNLWIS